MPRDYENVAPVLQPNATEFTVQETGNANAGWFMAMRTPDVVEVTEANPLALVLAHQIAFRACYKPGFNAKGLRPGEALIGDYRKSGMTRQQFRTAQKFLSKHGFATFRPTNKGTIARLTDERLFRVNIIGGMESNHQPNHQNNQQVTNGQPTANQQLTTNVELREGIEGNRTEENRNTPPSPQGGSCVDVEEMMRRIRIVAECCGLAEEQWKYWALCFAHNPPEYHHERKVCWEWHLIYACLKGQRNGSTPTESELQELVQQAKEALRINRCT